MPVRVLLAVASGAAVGACLRWWLGVMFNAIFPTMPLGTLAANLLGGLLMGCAMELLTRHAGVPAEVRLLATTGFLGGLTTFSTFSAEVVTLLFRKELLWMVIVVGTHVIGSLAMTVVGVLAVRAVYVFGGK